MVCSLSVNRWRLEAIGRAVSTSRRLAGVDSVSSPLGGLSTWCPAQRSRQVSRAHPVMFCLTES
jgi:hypothetical protein